MYKILFQHYLLKGFRSPGYHKNLIVNIFVGIMMLYFLALFLLIGFMLPKMLREIAPESNPSEIFHGIMLYGWFGILMIRYLMQPLNRLNIEHYQALPIKRSIITNYLILKPLLNPANYLMLCLTIPFAIKGITPELGAFAGFRFVGITIFIIWFNSMLAPFLKRKYHNLLIGSIALLIIGGGLAALEYFKIFSVFELSQHLFRFLVTTPFVWILAVTPCIVAFLLNKLFFSQNFYPEKFERKRKNKAVTQRFTFMERFGTIGELISLNIKLVLRHKRTKSTLYTALFFLAYGLIFYPNPVYNNQPAWLLFIAIFLSGTGMLIFGQWIINWDGAHFDYLMTRNIDTRTYIRSNYTLLMALCVASFILTSPYFFFGQKIIINHMVAFLYNAGVNSYVYLFSASFNTKRLELTRGSSMNMQGVSYKNFIVMIPLLGIPIILVAFFGIFKASNIALIILGALGFVGILCREPLLRMTERQFLRRKYALCAGFRKHE
jgi:hypothetical protein